MNQSSDAKGKGKLVDVAASEEELEEEEKLEEELTDEEAEQEDEGLEEEEEVHIIGVEVPTPSQKLSITKGGGIRRSSPIRNPRT